MDFVADLDTPGPSCSDHVNLQTNEYNPENDSRPISGLRTSYHGVAYQVQWNMVVAIEAKERWDESKESKSAFTFKTKDFKTEDPDAGKFDDVVWKYEIGGNGRASEHRYEYNFLQAKHKLNKDEEISFDDLIKPKQKKEHVKKEEGVDKRPFALEKYFISYKNEIKKGKTYEDGEVRNLIIATNINLNKDLRSNLFSKVKAGYIPILDLMNQVTNKELDVWEIKKEKRSHYNRVREKLLGTYNSTKLVSDLGKCLFDHKPLSKGSFISPYLFDLMQNNIIDESGKFSREFLENRKELSQKARNFHALLKESLNLGSDFSIPNPKAIAELFASKIKHASDFEVKIARLKPQRKVIDENLDKLANFVLVEDIESKVRFSNVFWTKDKLPGNLEDFRNRFKEELTKWKIIRSDDSVSVIADNIKKYKFKITGKNQEKKEFQTCKEILIEEEAFLKSFKINIDISELKLIKLATDENRLLKLNILRINGKFCDEFINGNDDLLVEGQEFRRFVLKEGFDNKRKSLSNDFELSKATNFADEIASLICTSANQNNQIQIIRKKSIIIDNVDKLANYVFVKNDESEVKFSFIFWKEKDNKLPGNLKDFRQQLKRQLGLYSVIDEQDTGAQIAETLQKFSFKIAKFDTCSESLVDEKAFLKALEKGNIYENIRTVLPFNTKLPTESLEGMQNDVDEFFSKLRFVVNYSQNDLDEFIKKKCRDFTGFVSDFVAYKFQVMIGNALSLACNDFISNVKQVDSFFKESLEQLDSLTLTGLTEERKAKAELYGIKFCSNSVEDLLKLENESKHFLDSDKQVFSLYTEQKDLTDIKFFQALEARSEYRNRASYAALTLNSAIRIQNCVTKGFESETKNLLVIYCETIDRNIDSFLYYELFSELLRILKSCKSKKIILITQENEDLASKFKSRIPGKYEERKDKQIGLISLADQEKILSNRTLIFQGKKTKLKELLSNEESKKLVNGAVLFDIIEGKEIRIGSCLPSISDKNSPAYSKVMEVLDESNERHLKDVKDDIFVISGIDRDTLARRLKLDEDKIVVASEDSIFPLEIPFQFVVLDIKDNNESVNVFESVCRQYQEILSIGQTEEREQKLIHLIEFHNGGFLWNRYYDPNFYIDRRFNNILIDKKFIDNYLKRVMFAKNIFLAGKIQTDEFVKQFEISEEKIASTLDDLDVNKPILILSRGDDEKEAQQTLKDLPPNCNFHWIQSEGNSLIWKRSRGEMETISQFCKYDSSPEDCNDGDLNVCNIVDEKKLVNERFVVISDVPGMGKSTTLFQLSESYTKLHPSHWVIRVNLKDCERAIDDHLRDYEDSADKLKKVGPIVNFLSKIDSEGFKHPLAKEFLRYKFASNSDRILLIMDGFDEIREDHGLKFIRQKKVSKLLEFLKKRTNVNVLITTRHYDEEKRNLECALSVLSHNFCPVTDDQVHKYIERVWQNSLKLRCNQNELNVSYLRTFVTVLYDKCREVFGGSLSSFVGVPLQLQMLAVAYIKKFKEFEEKRKIRGKILVGEPEIELKKAEEKFLKELNFSSLYADFLARKYEIFFQEKNRFDKIRIDIGIKDMAKESYELNHKLLAFRYLADDSLEAHTEFFELFSSSKDRVTSSTLETLNRVGIIHSLGNDRIDFVHRTFAEYYVSELIIDALQKIAQGSKKSEKARLDAKIVWKFVLHHVFLYNNYNVIRNFINCKLSYHPLFVHLKTNFANHERIVHELFRETLEESCISVEKQYPKSGKVPTQLHAAVQEDLLEMVEFILKLGPRNFIMDIHLLPVPSCYDMSYAPWEKAVDGCKVKIIKVLLKYAKKIGKCQYFLDYGSGAKMKHTINFPLYRAASCGSFKMVQCLVESGACTRSAVGTPILNWFTRPITGFAENVPLCYQGFTPLHCAFWARSKCINPRNAPDRLKTIQYLLENGSQAAAKDGNGNTPLHLACVGCGEGLSVMQMTLNEGEFRNCRISRESFLKSLRSKVHSQSVEVVEKMVKLLVTNAQPIKECNCTKEQFCPTDVSTSNFIDAVNNDGYTPIFLAAASRLWNVVDYLMSSVDCVYVSKLWYGGTTLHFLAAEAEKDLSSILEEFLRKSGIDVNVKTNVGETPLHWAAKNNNVKAVIVLLGSGADKNVKNWEDQTALDLCKNPTIIRLIKRWMC